MRNAETSLAIIRERGSRGLHLEDVYRRLYNPDLYLRAYGRIYKNAGATTKGVTEESVDGMSMGKIASIIGLLRDERYRWSPVRRVFIPKRNGKLRPLGLPTWSDKLLQEVMRSILEAYFEPQFSDCSHGFRPGRGCHTALQTILRCWTGTKWFIEGDIKGCFDNIDHAVLLSILREKVHDDRFLILVEGLLKAGYLEQWAYRPTLSGTPQGGVISPLLANIYLDRLDKFVLQTLIPEFTKGVVKKSNREYKRIYARIRSLKKRGASEDDLRPLWKEAHGVGSMDEFDSDYRRLRYIRYADDFLLAFDGPRAEAEAIKGRLVEFLSDNLKLELSPEKTLITHAGTGQARFLGYDISSFRDPVIRRGNGLIALRMPPQMLEEKVARYMVGGDPAHRPELIDDSDLTIIGVYGSEYRGIVQYYAYARNRSWLHRLHWVMRTSLLKTLASKHKSSVSKMARRYTADAVTKTGMVKCLEVTVEREGKPSLSARFGGLSLKPDPYAEIEDLPLDRDRFAGHNELVRRLMADECELCGSREGVQVHHVRGLADLRVRGRRERPHWVKVMASRRRKTLVVCESCHDAIHAGRPTRMRESSGIDQPESRMR